MNATDRIDYTRPFTENVQGTLYARFRRDADGAPLYELDGGDRVYTIEVSLHSPQASRIKAVEYSLDDVGSDKQLGRSEDRHNDFPVVIESAGDALLLVRVVMSDHPEVVGLEHRLERRYEQRAWLSQMLENGYEADLSTEVKSALLRIKVN